VTFVGVVDRVAPLLATADLLLLTSSTESFGLVALEAMASGVPVIASDVGGIPEVVEHGVTGFLAPMGDVDRMAEHAIALLQDRDMHGRFCSAARNRAVENFDQNELVSQYETLYERVISGRSPSVL